MKYLLIVFSFLAGVSCNVFAQDNLKELELIPRGMLFEPLVLDPTEALIYGGLNKLWDGGETLDGLYIPVNIGFQQSFFRWEKPNNTSFEFGMDVGVFTQFTVIPYEGTYLGELMNIDYKVSGLFNYQRNKFTLRTRLFHMSSHLGDDYILRNEINEPNPGTKNYEQVDFTGEYRIKSIRYYLGAGMVITKYAQRERFSLQAGFMFNNPIKEKKNLRFMFGLDVKSLQQNDYRPEIRPGIGIELGPQKKVHVGLMLEYYNGNLPYSILEYNRVQWLGISAYFHPAKRSSSL